MTYRKLPKHATDFRKLVERAGFLTLNGVAEFVGVHIRTVQRWWYGEIEPPQSVTMLLESAAAMKSGKHHVD